MSFLETPRFSDRLANGLTGGPEFNTTVLVLRSGYEQRNREWSQQRMSWDAATAVRTLSDFQEIEDFFYAVGGRLHGFRLWDRADYQVVYSVGFLRPLHDTVQVGTAGLGYGVPTYQLVKRYTRGALSYDRDIRKPRDGVVVRRASSAVTVGGGAGNIAIDTTTGLVTFVADQSRSISAHTVGADHLFTPNSAFSPQWSAGQRVYATGVTGTAADVLNDLSHEIVEVDSDGNIIVSTSTAGLTASGGSLHRYPQASQALDWAGEFDVPVRFDTDRLDRTLVTNSPQGVLVECRDIPIVEIRV